VLRLSVEAKAMHGTEIVGYILLAAIVCGILFNFKDIRRYVSHLADVAKFSGIHSPASGGFYSSFRKPNSPLENPP
jgi:hypothetical protein